MDEKTVSYVEDVEGNVAGEGNEESSEENLSLYNEQDSRHEVQPPVPADSIVPEQSIASNNEANTDQENASSSNMILVEEYPEKNFDNNIIEHKLDVVNNYFNNSPDDNNAGMKHRSKFKCIKSTEKQPFFKEFLVEQSLDKTKKDKQVKFVVDDLYSIGLFNLRGIVNFNDCFVCAVREFIDQDSSSIISVILASRDRDIYLCYEYFRLATFCASNCDTQQFNIIRLASAGYYLDRDGTIRCFHCFFCMDQHGIDCVRSITNLHNVPIHHPYLQLNGQNLEHNNATIDTGPGHQPLFVPGLPGIPAHGKLPLPVPNLPGISVYGEQHLPVPDVLGIAVHRQQLLPVPEVPGIQVHGQQDGLAPTDNQVLYPKHSASQDTLLSAQRKNAYLKKRILCVICVKEVRNMLFLPCQHFLCCQYCSSCITQCPVCCAVIKLPFQVYW